MKMETRTRSPPLPAESATGMPTGWRRRGCWARGSSAGAGAVRGQGRRGHGCPQGQWALTCPGRMAGRVPGRRHQGCDNGTRGGEAPQPA